MITAIMVLMMVEVMTMAFGGGGLGGGPGQLPDVYIGSGYLQKLSPKDNYV